jgi:hypothetical protein
MIYRGPGFFLPLYDLAPPPPHPPSPDRRHTEQRDSDAILSGREAGAEDTGQAEKRKNDKIKGRICAIVVVLYIVTVQ